MSRSRYDIQFTCTPNEANNIIQAFLSANSFELKYKNNEQYYRAGDSMVRGYRYFNYIITGNSVSIFAWLKGAIGEFALESHSLSIPASIYKDELSILFQELSKPHEINNNNMSNQFFNQQANANIVQSQENPQQINNIQMPQNPNYQPNNPNLNNMSNSNYQQYNPYTNQSYQFNYENNFSQNFQNEASKKQETMCEIGFWLSLVGLLLSFLGITYGIIVYIIDFFFASQGLKTRKQGKAIATIVLSIVSIIIVVVQLILAFSSRRYF